MKKKPCLDKQGVEPKKRKRNDIYISIYILYGVLTCALASCKFTRFFLFCLPGWSASEFNLNRSRPVAFPEPSALVMESLSRRRVVHGCFSGCVFFSSDGGGG